VLVALPVSYLMSRMAVQLSKVHTQLRRLADTDELTGLTNRRSFFSQATEVLQSSQEEQKTLSLLVIDADYFKQLNDTYGHATGDAALYTAKDAGRYRTITYSDYAPATKPASLQGKAARA